MKFKYLAFSLPLLFVYSTTTDAMFGAMRKTAQRGGAMVAKGWSQRSVSSYKKPATQTSFKETLDKARPGDRISLATGKAKWVGKFKGASSETVILEGNGQITEIRHGYITAVSVENVDRSRGHGDVFDLLEATKHELFEEPVVIKARTPEKSAAEVMKADYMAGHWEGKPEAVAEAEFRARSAEEQALRVSGTYALLDRDSRDAVDELGEEMEATFAQLQANMRKGGLRVYRHMMRELKSQGRDIGALRGTIEGQPKEKPIIVDAETVIEGEAIEGEVFTHPKKSLSDKFLTKNIGEYIRVYNHHDKIIHEGTLADFDDEELEFDGNVFIDRSTISCITYGDEEDF